MTKANLDETTNPWQEELGDGVNQIIERKRSSPAGRKKSLTAYIGILCGRYAKGEIHPKRLGLFGAFVRSLEDGKSEKEALLTVKGMCHPSCE